MNKHNIALCNNSIEAKSLGCTQHSPQYQRLAQIENFLFTLKKTYINKTYHWVKLTDLAEMMNQTSSNVIRLVRVLEQQGRVHIESGVRGHGLYVKIARPQK